MTSCINCGFGGSPPTSAWSANRKPMGWPRGSSGPSRNRRSTGDPSRPSRISERRSRSLWRPITPLGDSKRMAPHPQRDEGEPCSEGGCVISRQTCVQKIRCGTIPGRLPVSFSPTKERGPPHNHVATPEEEHNWWALNRIRFGWHEMRHAFSVTAQKPLVSTCIIRRTYSSGFSGELQLWSTQTAQPSGCRPR